LFPSRWEGEKEIKNREGFLMPSLFPSRWEGEKEIKNRE
jgi:hypothetical protein